MGGYYKRRKIRAATERSGPKRLQKGQGHQVPLYDPKRGPEKVVKSHRSGFYFGDSIQAQAKRDISACALYMAFLRRRVALQNDWRHRGKKPTTTAGLDGGYFCSRTDVRIMRGWPNEDPPTYLDFQLCCPDARSCIRLCNFSPRAGPP